VINQRLELVVLDCLEFFREIMLIPEWKDQFDLNPEWKDLFWVCTPPRPLICAAAQRLP